MKSPIKIWLEWYETLRTGFSSSAQLPTQDSSSINAEIDNPERLWDLSDLDATLADTVSEPSASEIQTNIADTKNSPLDLEEDVNSDSDPDISDLIDISEDDSADEIQVNTKPVNKPKVQYASLNADSDALENSTDEEANDNEEELVGVSQVKAVNLEASSETEDSLPEEGAKDESDSFWQIKKFLSYMPNNVYQQPPVLPTNDPVDREEPELLSIIPRERTKAYDMRRVIELIVDDGDYFEIKPEFGASIHTIFARIGGYTVGIVANNPNDIAGAMSADSADKQGHFVELCDHFHIPIVFLADVPGFMIGPRAESTGTLRHGMRAYWATYLATVPVFTVITRKNFGMAGQATANVGGINYRVGWPSGDWGSIPIEGGVAAAYRREIESAPDPDQRRAEIEAHLLQFRNPFRTAEAFGIEDIIDPRQTRSYIHRFLELAYETLSTQLGVKSKAGVRP